MKRRWKFLLPAALTLAILALGVLLPRALIGVLRSSYSWKGGAVAAAEVEVYSEEYETNRSALLKSIRQLQSVNEEYGLTWGYEIETAYDGNIAIYDSTEAIQVSGSADSDADILIQPGLWTDRQHALYSAGYGQLGSFLYAWDSAVAVQLLDESGSSWLLRADYPSADFLLGGLETEDNQVIFDLSTGVPICLNLLLEAVEITDAEEFCGNMISAYGQFVGVSFSGDVAQREDVGKQLLYYYVQSESMDGTFQIRGDAYFEPDSDTLWLCLFLEEA
ncbi:MAG: hypothetical protein LUE31_03390 [Lachnospiraceae bacterium]|nr:hypothetical protein [Lachnospiraceae bacterium]